VVLDHGHIEQVGTPREVYERPATPFVMGFLGPTSKLSGETVRPHDISLSRKARRGALKGKITRVHYLGFEVRVEVLLDSDEPVMVQLTRREVNDLGLEEGQVVWALPDTVTDVPATKAG
jgi:sulfate transport system ATP-binding protein